MKRLALLALLALGGCSKGSAIVGGPTTPIVDAAAAPEAGLATCLEPPGELPRPPAAGLPCELIPPELSE
jgi:hypothetical protein